MPSFHSVGILAILGLVDFALCQNVITSDTYFYGQSPPVYPAPNGSGTGDWAAAYSKAAAFVAQLTLNEKSSLTYGVGSGLVGSTINGCAGNIPPIERLGFPGLCLHDSGSSVRATDFVNGYASGLSVGASWNKNLAYQRAHALGGEFVTKGVNVALGPVIGPLGRIAKGGRNWEGFANDPYLAGSLAAETVRGIQERGVMTSVKHFIGNEQEEFRNPTLGGLTGPILKESVSANIDDKTMHELYLWPFADAVHQGTCNIMCSYQRLNNSYSCANSKLMNGILKTELGFQGFVVTDWSAQHAGIASAEAGLDMAMPTGSLFFGPPLTKGITNGSLPESRLTDMATRIMASWYRLGQDSPDYPAVGVGMPVDLSAPHKIVDARDPASKQVVFDGGVEGHVLVKNSGSLPLKSPKLLSLFGYDAKSPDTYNIGTPSDILPPWTQGFSSANISSVLLDLISIPNNETFSQIAAKGTVISGGGSGAITPPYVSSPFEAFSIKSQNENTALFWDFTSGNPAVNGDSEACLVFINAFSTEGTDRSGLHDDFSDGLVKNVAEKCNNTIVIIHNAGVRLVDQFIEHPNVTAVVFAHVPGQDSGKALVSLLYGESIFSGKLPYSVPKNESEYGDLFGPAQPEGQYINYPQANFSEGVYIDYRAFDAKNITPRYEFGYGLSYTTFNYSNLQISKVSSNTQTYPSGPIREGGQTDLWDVLYQVTADVKNTGGYDGAEVAQLYVGIPGGPVKQLRGFSKVGIQKGNTVTVEFDLKRRDLSEWDVLAQAWKLQSGSYNVWVGSSSRTLPLSGTLTI